jgi:AmpE protein
MPRAPPLAAPLAVLPRCYNHAVRNHAIPHGSVEPGMTIAFIAVLLVLFTAHGAPELARWRDFSWLQRWQDSVARRGGDAFGLVLCVAVPVLVCALVQVALHDRVLGLFGLAFATAVLFYCWGPRDLERDAEAIDKAPDSEQRAAAAQALRGEEARQPLAFECGALVEATFTAALRRWFGVMFWFAVLGPAGALLYRLVQLLAFAPAFAEGQSAAQRTLLGRSARSLDWLPAHLMALSLALVSDFDAVFKTWQGYHAASGKGYFALDLGFLDAIARASVDADVAAETGSEKSVRNPLVALDDAMVLVRRVLVVWVTLLAVIVLAGWFA